VFRTKIPQSLRSFGMTLKRLLLEWTHVFKSVFNGFSLRNAAGNSGTLNNISGFVQIFLPTAAAMGLIFRMMSAKVFSSIVWAASENAFAGS